MVVVFPGPEAGKHCWAKVSAVPLRCRGAGSPRCLSWTSGRSEPRSWPTHVPRNPRQRGTKPPEAARAQAGLELLAEERRHKLPSPTDSPDSFAPSFWSALRGERSGPNLRSRMRPSAVSPREELCSRQQRRPRRRDLDRGRHGENKSSPKRTAPAASGSGTGRKGRHFVAQQRRRTLSSPTVGPASL